MAIYIYFHSYISIQDHPPSTSFSRFVSRTDHPNRFIDHLLPFQHTLQTLFCNITFNPPPDMALSLKKFHEGFTFFILLSWLRFRRSFLIFFLDFPLPPLPSPQNIFIYICVCVFYNLGIFALRACFFSFFLNPCYHLRFQWPSFHTQG